MKPYWTNGRATLWQGHVLDALAAMIEKSVHMVATSPPYYSLRDYGLEGVEWPPVSYAPMAGLPEIEIAGCAEGCEHVWVTERVYTEKSAAKRSKEAFSKAGPDNAKRIKEARWRTHQYCQLCSGWRGSLGLEPSVEMFVGHIVLVARALWRVLRDDGTFFCNLGDSYSGGGGYAPDAPSNQGGGINRRAKEFESSKRRAAGNLKPKDLIGIPWRVAFALQADGWYLRSSIIWAKGISFCPTWSGSCMPESTKDRPTKSYENVFVLAKREKYFYDHVAVREANMGDGRKRGGYPNPDDPRHSERVAEHKDNPAGRNLRSVWTINPGSYAGAHFATFPPKLVAPMIKAGTSAKGCCPECGKAWVRVTEKAANNDGYPNGPGGQKALDSRGNGASDKSTLATVARYDVTTTGWRPTCTCGTEHPIPQEELDADPTLLDDFEIEPFEPVPCTVLDPFAGTFTTGKEAIRLGRHAVGIELSKTYCDDHIIPRLSEPLFEWAEQERVEQEQQEPEPEIEQGTFL